jgi:hypothetical protein
MKMAPLDILGRVTLSSHHSEDLLHLAGVKHAKMAVVGSPGRSWAGR